MFHALIRNGKLTMGKVLAERFEKWKRGNEGVEVVIQPWKPTRSSSQNAYYWVYLGIIAKETGELENDLHQLFKRKFLAPVFRTVMGEEVSIPRSTTKLSKMDFGDYLDKICALTNVPLPDPEAAGYISNSKPMKKTYQPSREEMEIKGDGPTF